MHSIRVWTRSTSAVGFRSGSAVWVRRKRWFRKRVPAGRLRRIQDKELIQACAKKAVECALAGVGGVVGEDEDKNGELRACEFARIKGGKPFDIDAPWFVAMLQAIGQPKGEKVVVSH